MSSLRGTGPEQHTLIGSSTRNTTTESAFLTTMRMKVSVNWKRVTTTTIMGLSTKTLTTTTRTTRMPRGLFWSSNWPHLLRRTEAVLENDKPTNGYLPKDKFLKQWHYEIESERAKKQCSCIPRMSRAFALASAFVRNPWLSELDDELDRSHDGGLPSVSGSTAGLQNWLHWCGKVIG